jgi:hypothetical protein
MTTQHFLSSLKQLFQGKANSLPRATSGNFLTGHFWVYRLFLLFFLGGRGFHFAHGAGFTAGGAFLRFAAGVHLAAAFLTGKDGHGLPPERE